MEKEYIIRKMYELADKIEYEVNDISYLKEAMRSDILHEKNDGCNRKNYSNDAMATVGDTILKFVLSEYFYNLGGNDRENITSLKSQIENNKTLFKISDRLIIDYAYNEHGFFNRKMSNIKVRHPLHDPYIEAIVYAIYLDRGIDYVRDWIIKFLKKEGLIKK